MKRTSPILLIALLGLFAVGVTSFRAGADGSETLGPPVNLDVASGTGIVGAGTGLFTQPGMINITVPSGATIKQVLLYWGGRTCNGDFASTGDNTIVIDGNPVTGTLIGSVNTTTNLSISYRADITNLGLVTTGNNTLAVSGLDFTNGNPMCEGAKNAGAGILVIFDDETCDASIQLRDGNDFAFLPLSGSLSTTTPQTFTFPAEASSRTATLELFVGDVAAGRPNAVKITVDGTMSTLVNLLNSAEGPQWDALTLNVEIPAGATMLTVQVLSQSDGSGNLPASLFWVTAALSVPQTCPVEGGDEGCTPGYWKNHVDSWAGTGFSPNQTAGSVFSGASAFPSLASKTLLQSLAGGGGSGTQGAAKILLRAGVAALLNASHPGVEYPRTTSEIIADVNAALLSGDRETILSLAAELDADNNLGCPLN